MLNKIKQENHSLYEENIFIIIPLRKGHINMFSILYEMSESTLLFRLVVKCARIVVTPPKIFCSCITIVWFAQKYIARGNSLISPKVISLLTNRLNFDSRFLTLSC